MDCIFDIIGIIGVLFLIGFSYLIFLRKIVFDRILVNGFSKYVIFIVLFPFIFFWIFRYDSSELLAESPSCLDSITKSEDSLHLLWAYFYHFLDPGNQHMVVNPNARIPVFVISILGVFFFNGLLVTAFINWVDQRREKCLKGKIRYNYKGKNIDYRFRNYVVIIGAHDMVYSIIKQLFSETNAPSYLLIQTLRDVETFRHELELSDASKYINRIIIYSGSSTSLHDINSLRLDRAREVYILGENVSSDNVDSFHDSMNLRCLQLIANVSKRKELVCRVMFEHQTTFSVYQISGVKEGTVTFRPFNYYEMWAQKVLISKKNDSEYLPLEGRDGIKQDDKNFVHLIIVGMSKMGIAMAIEAAHLAHYPNFENGTNEKKIRTRITFIDSNAKQEMDALMVRFKEMFALARWRYIKVHDSLYLCKQPTFDNIYSDVESFPWHVPTQDNDSLSYYKGEYLGEDFIDIEWEFIHGDWENPCVQKYMKDAANAANVKLTVAICLSDTNQAVSSAIYLPYPVYQKALQIWVYQRYDDSLISNIAMNPRYNTNKIKAFGMLSSAYDVTLVKDAEFIGSRVYEEYKLYMEKRGVSDHQSSEGKTPDAMLWSNYYNANMFWTRLRCIDFDGNELTDEQLDILAKVEHNRWNVEQLLLRYHPLKQEEQAEFFKIPKNDTFARKNEFKRIKMAHLDICSNKRLREIDKDIWELDRSLVRILPRIYKELNHDKQ